MHVLYKYIILQIELDLTLYPVVVHPMPKTINVVCFMFIIFAQIGA